MGLPETGALDAPSKTTHFEGSDTWNKDVEPFECGV